MRPLRPLLVAAALLALAGCASNPSPPPGGGAQRTPQARCLVDGRGEDSMRPLFFLFCIQQP